MTDQAEALRRIAGSAPSSPPPLVPGFRTRVLAITSGKGGVGKTNLSVNLSYALMELGRRVILLDADVGLANVDVLLGTVPPAHLGQVLAADAEVIMTDLVYTGPGNLRLIAGAAGIGEPADLPDAVVQKLIRGFQGLDGSADFLILDTGAGIGRLVTELLTAADEVVLVTTPEPTALTDAYAVVKTLVRRQPGARIGLVVNQALGREEAHLAAQRLRSTVLRFLNVPLDVLGYVPQDAAVPRAVREQTPFFLNAPTCPAAQSVRTIARQLAGVDAQRPRIGLFFHRLARALSGRPETVPMNRTGSAPPQE